jgi:glycosyltransferase involved in cell wall biosynthesis
MKIVALSETDIRGGAARASYRLHQGLQSLGVDSQILVREKLTQDPTVIPLRSPWTKLGPRMNRLAYLPYSRRRTDLFCSQWFPDRIAPALRRQAPDLVQLHWVTNGFMRIETLARLARPLVWTLHDLWPFTGGCHYPVSLDRDRFCDRYNQGCGVCPALGSTKQSDLSARTWQRKARAWARLDLHLVAPSQWLAHIAQSHPLLGRYPLHTIPHGLNLNCFTPQARPWACQQLNLPSNTFLIGFGALGGVEDDRKGFDLLRAALAILAQRENRPSIALVVLGSDKAPADLPYPVYPLGVIHRDEDLAMAYSALDVMVVPSRQETFGQMVSESLACGTPVVAFKAHAMPDLILHQQNGYLAQAFDAQDLAQGLDWIMASAARSTQLRQAARQQALEHFNETLQAERYLNLYRRICPNTLD